MGKSLKVKILACFVCYLPLPFFRRFAIQIYCVNIYIYWVWSPINKIFRNDHNRLGAFLAIPEFRADYTVVFVTLFKLVCVLMPLITGAHILLLCFRSLNPANFVLAVFQVFALC